jgi:signal transduction histidine kinase
MADRMRERWLESIADVNTKLLGGVSGEDALRLVAEHAAELSGADCALIVLRSRDDRVPRIAAGAGPWMEALLDIGFATAGSPVEEVVDPLLVNDLSAHFGLQPVGLGPGVVVPIRAGPEVIGGLFAARRQGARPFEPELVPMLASFADTAALALGFAEKLRSQRLLDVLADRDRIARDLHDHVIQRLFVTGLNLQGTLKRVTDQDVRRRVQHAVEQLDQTVLEIRTSIFNLQHTGPDRVGLRERLLDLVAELTEETALSSKVRMTGSVDDEMPEGLAEHAEAVVREAVTNTVRHAHADELAVTVEAADEFVISVVDNGIGLPSNVKRSGLANLAQRAGLLGGRFVARSEPGGGTRLTWQVPLH